MYVELDITKRVREAQYRAAVLVATLFEVYIRFIYIRLAIICVSACTFLCFSPKAHHVLFVSA